MKSNKVIPEDVLKLANEHRFDSVMLPTDGTTRWNNYLLFIPFNKGRRNICGLPMFILKNDKELRFATEKESNMIIFNS